MSEPQPPEEPERPRITRGPPPIPPPDSSVPPPPTPDSSAPPPDAPPGRPPGDDEPITLKPREPDIPIPLPTGSRPPPQRRPGSAPAPRTSRAPGYKSTEPQHPFHIGATIARSVQVWIRGFVVFNLLTLAILSPAILLDLVAYHSPDDTTSIEKASQWAHLLLGGMVSAVVVVGVAWQLEGLRPSLGECVGRAVSRIPSLLGVGVLQVLALGGVGIFLGVVAAAGAGCLGPPGLLILGIPSLVLVIWVYLAFYLALPVVVVEEQGTTAAIRRSSDLIRGNRLRVFVVLLAFFAPFLLVMLAIGAVSLSAPDVAFWSGIAITVPAVSFQAVQAGVVYHDLRLAVDGISSRALAEQLGAIFD